MNKRYYWLIAIIFCMSILSSMLFAEITIDINSPLPSQRFEKCTPILFSANLDIQGSDLKDLRIFANGFQIRRITKAPYEYEWDGYPGYYEWYFVATDDDGNAFYSDTTVFIVEPWVEGNLLLNSQFDCDNRWPWVLNGYEGGAGSFLLDDYAELSEGAAILIDVTAAGSLNWHLQFSHLFPIKSGHTYEISFMAETFAAKDIQISFQQANDPYTVYFAEDMTIDGAGLYGPYTFNCVNDDETVSFKFMLAGNSEAIYLDNILIIDSSISGVEEKQEVHSLTVPESFVMASNYPNPFNSQTQISYSIAENAFVELSIYNMIGEKQITLVHQEMTQGQHEISWNGMNANGKEVPSGMYLYKLDARTPNATHSVSNKVLLLK